MQNDKASLAREIPPDERKLTKIQASRLAALADVKVEEIESLTHAKLIDRLKWKVDPNLFLFRRVCGKVVKKDPITGIEYPVPYATVIVEDTDCHLISYFPKPWPWGWFFPFHCHREVLATTKTDACEISAFGFPDSISIGSLSGVKGASAFPSSFAGPRL